jgi:hypothetical protein
MNTPQPIPAIASEAETYDSEFLLNRATMMKRRKGFISGTKIKNPDGSYTVTWVPASPAIKVGGSKKRIRPRISSNAVRNTFSPGASQL